MCACYTRPAMSLDDNLKTVSFWLRLGTINHAITLAVIALGCVYSGFTCKGEPMKEALSLYAFTIFTPQVALGVIVFIALFLASNSLQEYRQSWRSLVLFLGTLAMLILFANWR
jgi:hypothetical protein